MDKFKGFYKKTREERIEILNIKNTANDNLKEDTYIHMIENAIGIYEVPLGVAPGFLINDKEYNIPMATEEPSVIAAASNAAKIIKQNGGFKAHVLNRLMIGQIAFDYPNNIDAMQTYIKDNQEMLFNIAKQAHPSIHKREGGLISIQTKELGDTSSTPFFIIYLSIDVKEAMGANIVNTILEAMSKHLAKEFNQEPLMSILSNLADQSLVEAECIIDPKTLKNETEIAKKIKSASDFASLDPYRAATHNKGIMNGISALVLASGNDTRAMEASAHTYANQSPLATWTITKEGFIKGKIITPAAIGSVGGSIQIHPKAKLTQEILKYKNAKELMCIIASLGLAQNFAALYALTTDGIQKGHMALQAKTLAISVGAQNEEIEILAQSLIESKIMNLENAEILLRKLRNQD